MIHNWSNFTMCSTESFLKVEIDELIISRQSFPAKLEKAFASCMKEMGYGNPLAPRGYLFVTAPTKHGVVIEIWSQLSQPFISFRLLPNVARQKNYQKCYSCQLYKVKGQPKVRISRKRNLSGTWEFAELVKSRTKPTRQLPGFLPRFSKGSLDHQKFISCKILA